MNELPDFFQGNWLQRYHEGFTGDRVGSFGIAPIRPIIIPFLFTKQYIRISVDSIDKRANWRFGARIAQTITTVLGFDDVVKEFEVDLGKPEVLNMLISPDGYRVRLSFPTWLTDVDVVIHEFVESN